VVSNQKGTLGNSQQLKNAMDLFYISIINRQNYITEKLNALRPNLVNGEMLDFTISKLNPFSLLPDSVLSRLSDDEVRDIFEIPEVVAEVDDKEIASRFSEFGVGGVQGILDTQSAVSGGTMNLDAGVKVLQVIYGFTLEDSTKMLGGSTDLTGELVQPLAEEGDTTNAVLRDLTGRQMQGLQRIIRKFNKDELTYDQAAQLLKSSYGFADEDVNIWLVTKEEEEDAIN